MSCRHELAVSVKDMLTTRMRLAFLNSEARTHTPLTHAHWALHSECRGAPVVRRGDARVAPPCPTTSCVWRSLPYLTLP